MRWVSVVSTVSKQQEVQHCYSALEVHQDVLLGDTSALQHLGHRLTHLFVTNHDGACFTGFKLWLILHCSHTVKDN